MHYKETELQDCITITKKFERGAIFTPTEQANFALLSPILDGMRTQSTGYVNQAESIERTSNPLSATESTSTALAPNATALSSKGALLGGETTSSPAGNMDKSDEKDPPFEERLAGQFGLLNEEGNFDMAGIFDSDCIPCNLRVDGAGLESFFTEVGIGFLGGLSEYLNFYEEVFWKQIQQLEDMVNLFLNTDPYMDMCAFIKFFTEFMCLPDLARIISTLMVLMKKTSFDFSGSLDLIIQLVGPLLAPFLGNLVSVIEQFIMMVIKPIECIIDSIQAMIAKLDYNVLFENIQSLDNHIDLGGPKKGAWLPDEPRFDENEPRTPWVDGQIPRRDIVEGERFAEADFNMAGPLSTWINETNAEDQKAVEQAAEELAAVRRAGQNVDGSDPEAISKQREKERASNDKYRGAIQKRNMSYVGQANSAIERGVSGAKSSLIMIIGFLREGAQAAENFFHFIFDEFKKLMGEYVGGSGGLIGEIIKKNALVQIINLLVSIYQVLEKGAVCEDSPEDIKVEFWIPEQSGLTIWTDEDGSIHIAGSQEEIDAAMEALVEAEGVQPPSIQDGDGTSPVEKDKGSQPDTASQKLKSLIEFTGDPVLDSEIARMTERLTTPVNVVFKCPLNTSVAQTEQINQWIREINT